MNSAVRPHIVLAGVLAGVIGFAAAFAVVIAGLKGVGATDAQAISGLGILCISQGVAAIYLALRFRIPMAVAWSTPGAALLASMTVPIGGYAEAVGAFMVSSVLIIVCGWVPMVRGWVQAIPTQLSSAMLAGVLLSICLVPVTSVAQAPGIIGPVILTWWLVSLKSKLMAVPCAVVAAALVSVFSGQIPQTVDWSVTEFVWVTPQFSIASTVGIALPLFLVTMTSQNLAGVAVLKANGYEPPLGPALKVTGGLSVFNGLLGGHHVNLAAITAAMCADAQVDPDPNKRYVAAAAMGFVSIVFGLMTALVMQFALAAPPNLIETLGGLALVGALGGSLTQAVSDVRGREAAVVCFVVTAAGISVGGIGSAFWGLLVGGLIYRFRG